MVVILISLLAVVGCGEREDMRLIKLVLPDSIESVPHRKENLFRTIARTQLTVEREGTVIETQEYGNQIEFAVSQHLQPGDKVCVRSWLLETLKNFEYPALSGCDTVKEAQTTYLKLKKQCSIRYFD